MIPACPPHTTPAPAPILAELRQVGLGVAGSADTPGEGGMRIDWTLREGDWWMIAGLPGCGKSELLATLAGLMPPGRGEIRWADPAGAPDAVGPGPAPGCGVGLVFEGGGRLLHHLSVHDNIALPLRYHTNRTAAEVAPIVERWLEWADAAGAAPATATSLKLSVRQRVALARALSIAPRLLLLDNPLAGLSAPEGRWWTVRLEELRRGECPLLPAAVTLVVTCDDLRPWLDAGRQFALLGRRQWRVFGGRDDLLACPDPELREVLPPH